MKQFLFKAKKKILRGNRKVLYSVFRFDKWHIVPLLERQYARDIIRYLNSRPDRKHQNLVEIGCGIGDIIRNVDYRSILGLDYDANALKAAKFLTWIHFHRNIAYQWFNFPDSPLSGKFDVFLMVNWIHNISPDLLKENITRYFQNNLNPGGEILIDTVGAKNYKYNHSIKFLTEGLACSVATLCEGENMRKIFIIKKTTPDTDIMENRNR